MVGKLEGPPDHGFHIFAKNVFDHPAVILHEYSSKQTILIIRG